MSNPLCPAQAKCDGDEMYDGKNVYCTKHYMSEDSFLQIVRAENRAVAAETKLAELERVSEFRRREIDYFDAKLAEAEAKLDAITRTSETE